MRNLFWVSTMVATFVIGGCGGDETKWHKDGATTTSGGAGGGACGPDDAGPNELLGAGGDPAAGGITMADALAGLPPGDGPLRAIIKTEMGEITCTLEPTMVPNGVANFVGLARGRRPWRDSLGSGQWVKRRFYDGLIFHRIIDDFMAQGGDPLGTGVGGPGYTIDDEITSLMHKPGTLSYARTNAPHSIGSQFFITEVATDWLDPDFTIIGYCEPMATIQALTAVKTSGAPNDKPLQDVHMQRIDITRCPLP